MYDARGERERKTTCERSSTLRTTTITKYQHKLSKLIDEYESVKDKDNNIYGELITANIYRIQQVTRL